MKPKMYSERFDLRLNSFVKSKLEYLAGKYNCSQGEVVRMAILNMASQGEVTL